MKKLLLLLFIVFFSSNVFSQEKNLLIDGWKVNATSHTIPYFDGRDFNNDTYAPGHTSMKTVLGVTKGIGEKVDFHIALQDFRTWGNSNSLTSDHNNIHLMQGWVRFNNLFNTPINLKLGRFQMEYGNGRFIANSFWNYQERKFDGFLINYKGDNMFLDLFLTNHSSDISYQRFKYPNNDYSEVELTPYSGYNIYGLWYNNTAFKGQKFDIFAIWDENSAKNEGGDVLLNRYTVGFDYFGKIGIFEPSVEFGYQTGEKAGKDIAAYLAAVNFDFNFKPVKVNVGIDMHSGSEDGNAEEINTYDNYIAAKHKFMGLMDYFITARGAYNGVGVNDIHAGATYKFGKLTFKGFAHYFMANAENENIFLEGEQAGTNFGSEIDLIVRYTIHKGIFFEAGQGLFLPGDLMKALNNGNEDMAFLSYLRFLVKI